MATSRKTILNLLILWPGHCPLKTVALALDGIWVSAYDVFSHGAANMNKLEVETIADFKRDGACVLRSPFQEWVETLRTSIARNMAEPSADVATPWHQDQPYYCVDGNQTVSLWIPLDTVSHERTLEFVGGSQLRGKYFRPEQFNKTPRARFARREGVTTSPPFREVKLPHGALMDAPEFPLIG